MGNHEFDEGVDELHRIQDGGCHPVDGCQDGAPFLGAGFRYLAANVTYTRNRRDDPAALQGRQGPQRQARVHRRHPGGHTKHRHPGRGGGPDLPARGRDDQPARGAPGAEQGVRAFVVLRHQGAPQARPAPGGFQDVNGCSGLNGDLLPILDGLSDQVDVVASAHTRQAYVCNIDGKIVTSASSFGRLVTDFELTIDHQTKDVVSAASTARNVIVTRTVDKDHLQRAVHRAAVQQHDDGQDAHRRPDSAPAGAAVDNPSAGQTRFLQVSAGPGQRPARRLGCSSGADANSPTLSVRSCSAATARPDPGISRDGTTVVFDSFSPDLVDGDTNGVTDVFAAGLGALPAGPPSCRGRAATIVGTDGDNRLQGTPGRDVIAALGGADIVDGGGGDDLICLGDGDGDDRAVGGKDDDRLIGNQGDDRLVDGRGDDRCKGGRARDTKRAF